MLQYTPVGYLRLSYPNALINCPAYWAAGQFIDYKRAAGLQPHSIGHYRNSCIP